MMWDGTLKWDYVSIPSRGFWFFEDGWRLVLENAGVIPFQSPRGDFGFLKTGVTAAEVADLLASGFNPLAGILVF